MVAKLKKILNLCEEATQLRLRKACESRGASAYPKVRVADVLRIEHSGIKPEQYEFALKAHFDFVITDSEHNPRFAVEFDGPAHHMTEQRKKDTLKEELCKRFDFLLLRINFNYLPKKYRQMDLLSWLVEVWFQAKEFAEAQEKGEVAYDEPFIPGSFLALPGRAQQFPLWLSLDARAEIWKLHLAGECCQDVPSSAVGRASDGNYRAIAFVLVRPDCGVLAETGMRSQLFPIPISEALEDIVVLELFEKLKMALKGKNEVLPMSVIEARCKTFRSHYNVLAAFACESNSPLLDVSAETAS